MRLLRNYGSPRNYDHELADFNPRNATPWRWQRLPDLALPRSAAAEPAWHLHVTGTPPVTSSRAASHCRASPRS